LGAGKIFSFQRDLISFRLIKHSGDLQMMRAKLEGDKLPIPEKIIQKAGLKDGDEVEVGLEDGKVVFKPLASLAKFKRELRGCVESSKIDPLEAKRIWEA
jgi:antitoxin component of MazEF toxin-antitoxin module